MSQQCEWTRSLCDLFEPPDGKRGVFGLMCALSADTDFMEDVLKRFTGLGGGQRRRSGQCSLALFLDQHSDPITRRPGLYAPYPSPKDAWPSSKMYMHAKVALLGFGPAICGTPDYYRLIVSTGNWTKSAVNNEINLVWFCDCDRATPDEQAVGDMHEAARFWQLLLGLLPTSEAPASYYDLCADMRGKCAKFLDELEKLGPQADAATPRFFSTLQTERAPKIGEFDAGSIGAHVIQRFAETKRKRNFLITGSGFFEQPTDDGKATVPSVLENLRSRLKKKGLLTNTPRWWVLCNPATSGAVGDWIQNGITPAGCEYGKPKHPDPNHTANLHAKYIYMSNETPHSHKHGILYLGSGNLSKQGFMWVPRSGGTCGNVEAGVVVPVEETDDETLCQTLGINPDNDLEPEDIPAKVEGEESECESDRIACPPIRACSWNCETCELKIEPTDQFEKYDVVRILGHDVTQPDAKLKLRPDEEPPAYIEVTAEPSSGPWYVPVLDSRQSGVLCTPTIRHVGVADMLDALRSFPDTYDEDDEEGVDDNGDIAEEQASNGANPGFTANDDCSELRACREQYPLHQAAMLLETIAEKNQQVSDELMPDYVFHLRRTLIDGLDDVVRQNLASMREFLEPLRTEPGFAPSSRGPADEQNEGYTQVIHEFLDKLVEEDGRASRSSGQAQEYKHASKGN